MFKYFNLRVFFTAGYPGLQSVSSMSMVYGRVVYLPIVSIANAVDFPLKLVVAKSLSVAGEFF